MYLKRVKKCPKNVSQKSKKCPKKSLQFDDNQDTILHPQNDAGLSSEKCPKKSTKKCPKKSTKKCPKSVYKKCKRKCLKRGGVQRSFSVIKRSLLWDMQAFLNHQKYSDV